MYGTQTVLSTKYGSSQFENDVKMYGTQTTSSGMMLEELFENDVKMYGTQTYRQLLERMNCLRMM